MKDTLKFYSNIYDPLFKKKYNIDLNRGKPALRVFVAFCEQNNIKIKKAIDVGCSWGKTLDFWAKRKIKVYGVDVSTITVKYCKSRGHNCYLASATDLSMFDNKSFDLYTATDVYEHLTEEDLVHAVEEAKRITKKYFLIRVHPVLDKRGTLHLTVWKLEKWKEFFEKFGLSVINIGESGEFVYKNVFLMTI